MAFGHEGPDRVLSRMMLEGHPVASKENDPEEILLKIFPLMIRKSLTPETAV